MTKRAVAFNDRGYRIGESHHNAKLTDHEVDVVRQLREEHGLTYSSLAEKFEVSVDLIRQICRYKLRCDTPARWRFVEVTGRYRIQYSGGKWGFREISP